MEWNFLFFINSVLFGVGLAMDAFSVSLANGLNEPKMPAGRMCTIAGVFAFFQIIMPLIGWFCVRTVAETFTAFQRAVPWIALVLLLYIGGKMLLEGIRGAKDGGGEPAAVSAGGLLLQGLATSIDALSVGFTIVTFGICMIGLRLGKRFGTRLAGKASILGGVILIAIGIEIFLKGILS